MVRGNKPMMDKGVRKSSVRKVSELSKLPKPRGIRKVLKKDSKAEAARKVNSTAMKNSALRPEKLLNAAQTPQNPRAGFFNLPGELRNVIYEQTLIYDNKIVVGWGDTKKKRQYHLPTAASPTGVPALLQVCREIRAEGLSTFYSENTFAIHYDYYVWHEKHKPCNVTRFTNWLDLLGDNANRLRKIHLCFAAFLSRGFEAFRFDIFPYVKFVTEYPNVSVEVSNNINYSLSYPGCGCILNSIPDSRHAWSPQLVQLADKLLILRSAAWINEISSGDIVRFWVSIPTAGTGWTLSVSQLTYDLPVTPQSKKKDDWQKIAEKLALPYGFDLVRHTARGPSFILSTKGRPHVKEEDES